jgi:hypothetical protein
VPSVPFDTAGAAAGVVLAAGFGRYLETLVHGADAATLATSLVAVIVTVAVAEAATWSATHHIARLDISDVLRAESAD